MRIIAGELKSRKLLTPKDDAVTRPIPDRVKESLFGLLRGHCEGAAVFDAFAGTGALGLEAISRGAARCVFIEKDRGAAQLLQANIDTLEVADRCELVIGDALGPGALSRCPRPVTIVFLDPPYPVVLDPLGWRRVRDQLSRLIDLLTDDGFAILRTPWPFVHVQEEPGVQAEKPGGPPHKRGKHDQRTAKGRGGTGARGGKGGRDQGRNRPEDWLGKPVGGAAAPALGGRFVDDEGDEFEEIAWDETAEVEAAAEAGAPIPPPALPRPVRTVVDLKLPNAVGPETHVYHNTAVHLYMHKKNAGLPGPEKP